MQIQSHPLGRKREQNASQNNNILFTVGSVEGPGPFEVECVPHLVHKHCKTVPAECPDVDGRVISKGFVCMYIYMHIYVYISREREHSQDLVCSKDSNSPVNP